MQSDEQVYESCEQIIEKCKRDYADIRQMSYMLKNMMENWHERRCMAVLQLLCHVVHALYLLNTISLCVDKSISEESIKRNHLREETMKILTSNDLICRSLIRMGLHAFSQLCTKLRATGVLKDYKRATVEEQVVKFLHILGHNFKNRVVSFYFHRSNETTSRHFHNVLRAVISMENEFLKQPSGNEIAPQILNSNRFYPFFKVISFYLQVFVSMCVYIFTYLPYIYRDVCVCPGLCRCNRWNTCSH